MARVATGYNNMRKKQAVNRMQKIMSMVQAIHQFRRMGFSDNHIKRMLMGQKPQYRRTPALNSTNRMAAHALMAMHSNTRTQRRPTRTSKRPGRFLM